MTHSILIIEDNPANMELMRYLLHHYGCLVATATDGQQGMEKLYIESPDLVICDVQMPIIDGYEIARRMKDDPVLRQVPLIAVTALAMDQDKKRIMAAGFDGYITKPVDPETFVEEILEFLPAYKQSEE